MALEASVNAFCDFYGLDNTETETNGLRMYFRGMVEVLLERRECFSGEWDVLDAVRNVVEIYLEKNPQIKIGSKNLVEGELAEVNQKPQAILWDDDVYYFPERLFRCACGSLLETVSFLEIKREMMLQGFLRCHKISDGNFTVKKVIVNSFGCKTRLRFLAIERDFFDFDGELTLAERKGISCVLEPPMEKTAE